MPDHPDSPLIDGGLPRSRAERVSVLLDYAAMLLEERGEYATREQAGRLVNLTSEYNIARGQEIPSPLLVHPENEWEHWHELEDDVIALINDLLPSPWTMTLHPDDPGTVVIWDESEDSDG